MSIFVKVVVLVILFILLNFISIYTFDYKDYLDDKSKEVYIKEKRGFFDSLGLNFFNKTEYKSSDFTIYKKDNNLYLDGIFSKKEVAQDLLNILKINKEGNIKFDKNYKIDLNLVEELKDLVELQKNYLEDGSQITISNGTISVKGNLLNDRYKELFLIIANKSSNVNLILEDSKTYDTIENSEKEIQDGNNTDYILRLNDIQLLINNTLLSNKITFERRSSEPTQSSKLVIEKIADILNAHNTYKVEVAGHTDSRGNVGLNKKISYDRANRVKELLIDFGVEPSRITSVGYGNERPIAQDDKDGLSEINRRVEFNLGE